MYFPSGSPLPQFYDLSLSQGPFLHLSVFLSHSVCLCVKTTLWGCIADTSLLIPTHPVLSSLLYYGLGPDGKEGFQKEISDKFLRTIKYYLKFNSNL